MTSATRDQMTSSGVIMTVKGAVPSHEIGPTLAHEHLYCDISLHSGREDNRVMDVGLMAEELGDFKNAGGSAIIELTPVGVGRNAAKLREISDTSGVHVISGIAFYDESTYPDWVRTATVDTITDYFVREIEEGSEGVRAGLIGELMSHNEPVPNAAGYKLHEPEHRVFVAAAKAQRRTGVAISTHAALGRAGHAQLDVLEAAGADLTRVVIGHCDAHWHPDLAADMEYYLPILQRGAYCEFDMIGWTQLAPDEVRADRIAELAKRGYAHRLTLSTDTCRLSHLRRRGGRGLDFIWKSFLPRLRERGVSETDIRKMLEDAPRSVVTQRN